MKIEPEYQWRRGDATICANLRRKWPEQLKRFSDFELAMELNEDEEIVQTIFERMAEEDK